MDKCELVEYLTRLGNRLLKRYDKKRTDLVNEHLTNTRGDLVDKWMEHSRKRLHAFGIEALRDKRADWDHYFCDSIAIYINEGDTYAYTMIYDVEEGYFITGSWGDFFENWERSHETLTEEI